jgi:hypothetical protein
LCPWELIGGLARLVSEQDKGGGMRANWQMISVVVVLGLLLLLPFFFVLLASPAGGM